MLNPGDELLNYEIIGLLGKGGTSSVYLARDVNLDMQVALKVLHETDLRSSMMIHRLRTGAKAAAQLRHAHIQQVFYQGIDPTTNTPFVAMEYLTGGDLRARIGTLDLDTALSIFAQICDAVAYAHEHGVIHRDLKPDNVLFNGHGDAVVTDFDLARVEGGARRTAAGQTMGTLYYISPEQGRGDPIGPATDIYALGVILFELVTGTWPFTGASAADILRAHLTQSPPRASSLNPSVPPRVDATILRAMEKEPSARFQSVRELAAAVLGDRAAPAQAGVAFASATPAIMPDADENLATIAEAPKRTAPTLEEESDGAPFLRVITGPVADRVYQLGLATSIGASLENDIVLTDDYVSGMHARIDREGVDYLLRDLKSTNGTLVNDRELTPYVPHTLTPGDVIEVGDTRLEFSMD